MPMEIVGCSLWSTLRTCVLMTCFGLVLTVQDDQLGSMASNRPMVLNGASLTEIQCALRLLSVLKNVCGVTRFGPHLVAKRQAEPDEPATEILEGCLAPLQILIRVCSLQSPAPITGVFNQEGKRYMASEFVPARGRRRQQYGADQSSENPAAVFYPSRGRRSDSSSGQQHERERKGDSDVSNLYLNGFLGARG